MKPIKLAITRLLPVMMFIIAVIPMNSAADAKATLEWDAIETAPQGYRLYWRTDGQQFNFFQYFETGLSTRETIYGLDENTTYYFVVRAYVGNDTSFESNQVSFNANGNSYATDDNPPVQPYTIHPGSDAANVSLGSNLECGGFEDPDTADQHIQSRWQIFRGDNDHVALDMISAGDLTSLTVPDGTLEMDTAYYWTVTHINQRGALSPPAPYSHFTTSVAPAAGSGSTLTDGSSGGDGDGIVNTGCLINTLRR